MVILPWHKAEMNSESKVFQPDSYIAKYSQLRESEKSDNFVQIIEKWSYNSQNDLKCHITEFVTEYFQIKLENVMSIIDIFE